MGGPALANSSLNRTVAASRAVSGSAPASDAAVALTLTITRMSIFLVVGRSGLAAHCPHDARGVPVSTAAFRKFERNPCRHNRP